MPLNTFPNYTPSRGSKQTTDFRIREIKFRGYSQRAKDGLNAAVTKWQLQFNLRATTEINTIITFLEANQGLAFEWTPPRETTARKWICKKYSGPDHITDTYASLQCTFEEVFDL